MLLGYDPGPMWATNILTLVTFLIYLRGRKPIRWQLPISFLFTCSVLAFLFPRTGTDPIQSVLYEMMSGILLFGAIFMINDPVTSPKRDSSYAVYGIVAAITTMLFRYFGGFEESVPFAVLLANAFVPLIYRYNEFLHRMIRRQSLESRKSKDIQNNHQTV